MKIREPYIHANRLMNGKLQQAGAKENADKRG
jgi:hypothetical protein